MEASTPAPVSVLFARRDSIYKTLPGCDVWDADRDAMLYTGRSPVIAHPPCRLWGKLRGLSSAPVAEKELAFHAVRCVQENGGILEHPAFSTLWKSADLPRPGERDSFGGFTISIPQFWWGHRADKLTWLYIVGCEPSGLPEIPFSLGEASHVVGLWSGRDRTKPCRPTIARAEREHTPPLLAEWLLEAARRCQRV